MSLLKMIFVTVDTIATIDANAMKNIFKMKTFIENIVDDDAASKNKLLSINTTIIAYATAIIFLNQFVKFILFKFVNDTLTNELNMKNVKCNNIYFVKLKLKADFRKIRSMIIT